MANIELKIVALGDFSSVNSQIKSLQAQVATLQTSFAGVGLNANIKSQLQGIQSEFSAALVSSGAFTKQTVQLTSETEKFGKALTSGKLSLGQYFQIITGKSGEAQKAVQALAVEQVKLNNSIVQTDITKQGVYSVYTPTKIDELSKATEIAAAKQNILNLAIKSGSEQLINFGKNTQWAGRQLTVGMAVPAILFGSQAVNAFKSVNTELTRLQRLYGEGLTPPSTAELTQISNQVISLGKQVAQQMGIAQTETVKVAANFAAMGIQGQKLLDTTYQAQRLSKLGSLDAAQATNTIVALQNVYRVSSQDLGNAVNFLSSMQKQTTMSLQDMTDAIPRVGPIMQQLGGSYKDTAVMLLAMREAGVPAAQAANALKSAFASLIAPTKAASTEAKSFGINLDSIKNAGTPIQMIEQLQAAMKNLAPLAKEQLIEKIFGKFQFARISALLDNLGRVGSQTQNALKVAGATNAELANLAGQEMQQATESQTAKWQRTVETLKADLYPVGQEILKIATMLGNFAVKVSEFFNKLPGPIKSVAAALALLTVIAGPVLMLTGLFANLIGQGIKFGRALIGIFDGTKKWKDLLTPASVASQALADSFEAGMLKDVTAVDTLNLSLQKLIANLEAINLQLNASTGTSLFGSIAATASKEAPIIAEDIAKVAPKAFATGGYVPGNPTDGDAQPALLTGGEAVIPVGPARTYAPFINAMIDGKLPMHDGGVRASGRDANAVLKEKYSIPSRFSGMGGFGGSSGRALNRDTSYPGMSEEQAAIREAVIAEGGTEEEAKHLSRPVIEHTVPNIPAKTATLGIPYNKKSTDLNDTMAGLEAANLYGSALTDKNGEMSPIMSKYMDAVKKGKVSFEGLADSQEDLIKELEKMRPNVSADTEQHKKIMQSIAAYDKEIGASTGDQKKIRAAAQAQLATRKPEFYENGSTPAPGGLVRGSDKYEAQRQKIMASSEKGWKQHEFHIDATAMTKDPSLMTAENASKLKLNSAGAINFKSGPMTSALDEAVASGRESVKKQEGIHSPAKAWEEEVGKPMAQGLGKGFQMEIPGITESMKKSVSEMKNQMLIPIKSVGSEMHQDLLNAAKEAQKAAPAFKATGEKLGKAEGQGVQQEFNLQMQDMKEKTSAQNQIESMFPAMNSSNAISEANSAFNKKSLQDRFSGAFGSESKLAGMADKMLGSESMIGKTMSKWSNMSTMGKMGVGMGAGLVAQMAAPMINKALGSTGGAIANDAMSGLSMGSGFGPWGAAAGLAIGSVVGGIKQLIAQEKLHKQESEADFKSSADAMQFFGLQVGNTTHTVEAFTLAQNGANSSVKGFTDATSGSSQSLKYTTDQLTNFTKMVKDLPADNPLSLIVKQMTGANAEDAKKFADQFVSIQMAVNGLPKDKADQLMQLLLSVSGHSSVAASSSASPASQIDAIKSSINGVLADKPKLDALIGELANTAINTSSWTAFEQIVQGIEQSALGATGAVQGLISYLNSIGDTQGANAAQTLGLHGYSAADQLAISKVRAAGINVLTGSKNSFDPKTNTATVVPSTSDKDPNGGAAFLENNKQVQVAMDAIAKKYGAVSNAAGALATATSKDVAGWTAQKKAIDATIKSLENLQKTASQQTTYGTTMEDLKNQMLMAQSTGDNLKAQLLSQQILGTTRDYNAQTQIDSYKQKSDDLAQKIADANATAQTATQNALNSNTTATNNNTTAVKNIPVGSLGGPGTSGPNTDFTSIYGDMGQKAKQMGYKGKNPFMDKIALKGADGKPLLDAKGNQEYQYQLSGDAKRFIIEQQNLQSDNTFQFGDPTSGGTVNYDVINGNDKGSIYEPSAVVNPNPVSASSGQFHTKSNPLIVSEAAMEQLIAKNQPSILINGKGYATTSDDAKKTKMPLATSAQLAAYIKALQPSDITRLLRGSALLPGSGGYLKSPTGEEYQQIGEGTGINLKPVKLAYGGDVRGPGTSISDSIPAMLSNGEYVVNAGAVSHYGKGTFDALNARRLAKGGVARTNSSITYHKQHMNRTARHFADGGFVNPIDSVIGMISGMFDSKASGIGQGISKEGLETAGVSPALRLLQGKKQSNWDYLGVASMLAGPAKGLGLIPKTLGPLAALLEGADLTQNTFEAAGNAKQALAGSNHVYNVNVNVARVDSTVDMEKAISDAMTKIDARAKMNGSVSLVGRS